MTMTAADLIAALSKLPPGTPVVSENRLLGRVGGRGHSAAFVRVTQMHKAPDGTYGQFSAESLEHRNNVQVVVI